MGPGEIHLSYFPFGGAPGRKLRPALLLAGPVGPVPEFLAAYITSVIPRVVLPSDLLLDPKSSQHSKTRLKSVSCVRLHKLATLHPADILRYIGMVGPQTWADVEAKLRDLLNL